MMPDGVVVAVPALDDDPGLLTKAKSRRRSAGETVMDIPVRMRQIPTQQAQRESTAGFKCQI
jgi:predicted component of type VI protein secretion system